MVRGALIVVLAAAVLAACSAPTHIEGQRIRATAASAGALHAEAPAWFTAWWGDYLRHARQGHAVLALERNGLGGWYVYCGTLACHVLDHVSAQPIKDVHYRYPALEHCREEVAKANPTARPDCAVYAIRDKIVWEGPLPREGTDAQATRPEQRVAVGATPDIVGPSLALDRLQFWRMKWDAD